MKNLVGREIPDRVAGTKDLLPYQGDFNYNPIGRKVGTKLNKIIPGQSKLLDSIEKAVIECGLKDGMTISFHHHLRNGDYVLSMVMDVIANMGIKNLVVASSSLTSAHKELLKHIKSGVVSKIETSGMRGILGEEVSAGVMDIPIIIRSHGGRARAIECGEVSIDVAFLGVPSCDAYGNAKGYLGNSFCGSLGYAKIDAKYADKVVLITDNLVEYPNVPASISQADVDYIVQVNCIGDSKGIMSGATRFTSNPRELLIAKTVATLIEASGYFVEGFSMQTGTGGASLAVTRFLREKMIEKNIKASFGLGGITQQFVQLHEEGLIKKLFDTQSFDLSAASSIGRNHNHIEIDASLYANPHNKGCIANKLDFVVLSALEIDLDFNVNVITGSDGVIRGASGGHSDTAASSKMSIVVAPLVRGRIPSIVESVITIITPGSTVDVVVTDRGIAVNPLRQDLIDRFKEAKIKLCTIEELKDKALKLTGRPEPIEYSEKIVGLVQYRDGTVIDVIRQVK